MAIFRGVGGSGDSSDNSFLDAVTTQANAASASASAASASASAASTSASSILNLTAATGAAGSSASYNASTGVLTIPKGDTGDINNLTSEAVTNVLTGGTGISIASNGTITNDSPDQTVALTGAGGTSITGTYPNFTITSSSTLTDAQIKTAYENNADTNAFTDADHTKLDGIDTSIYLTSFDITTQTDPKYLRSDTADAASGFIQFSSGFNATTGTFTGGIVGTTAGFTGNVTVDGTVDGRDISADGTKLDNLIKEHTFYDNLAHAQGSSKILTTSYSTVGPANQTLSGLGSKHINFSLDLIFYNVSNTNDGELKVGVTCPNPANETTVNLGTVQSVTGPTSYFKEWTLTGDVTKHLSQYCGLSKNNSSGGASMGGMFKYRYSPLSDKTTISTSSFMNPPSVGDTIYLHPFDWEVENTAMDGQVFTMDGTTDSTLTVRRDFKQSLGYFTSSVNVAVKAREVSTADSIAIDAIRGSIVQIGN